MSLPNYENVEKSCFGSTGIYTIYLYGGTLDVEYDYRTADVRNMVFHIQSSRFNKRTLTFNLCSIDNHTVAKKRHKKFVLHKKFAEFANVFL